MGLATWDQPLDRYDYFQLSNNWQIVDFHDHSPGRGVQIPRGGIAPGAIGPTQLGSDIPWVPFSGTLATRPAAGTFGRNYYATDNNQWYVDNGIVWQTTHTTNGAVNIPTAQSTSSTTYTTLTTPDQVTGVVLPTNGLIRVWYQATWQGSVTAAPRAAIFLDSQLKVAGQPASAPVPQAAAANGPTNTNFSLSSSPIGLVSVNASQGGPDVTTGQAVCITANGTDVYYDLGGTLTTAAIPLGGPCDIFAAAGTYTVSVQFKASSGSVTASNRKLWVQALDFSG